MNDIDRLEDDVAILTMEVSRLQDKIGEDPRPFYLVAWNKRERVYLGVFHTEDGIKKFIESCMLKTGRGFKKRSPLYGVDKYTIERFYVPEYISVNPVFKG